jgi:hypothetical protein
MRNTIKEIEQFFALAIEQIRKDDNYGMPTTKEEWIKYVDTLGLQVNWILRDSDKIPSNDIEMCKDLFDTRDTDGVTYYMHPVNNEGYGNKVHYVQFPSGEYQCFICNDSIETYDLDELKAWIDKQASL